MSDFLPGSARNRREQRAENARMRKIVEKFGTMYDRINGALHCLGLAWDKRGLVIDREKALTLRGHPESIRHFAVCFDPMRASEMQFRGPTDAWDYRWRNIAIFEQSDHRKDRITLEWNGEPIIEFPVDNYPAVPDALSGENRAIVLEALQR